ncbi:MAG TPA: hypothetical protein VF794_21180 [Archangium sp.]|jgi:hypothetical protein|uniref:hypothetical protein n=1 Tax=Archangium sp. TaxID=1872627 RepID=UPI002ED82098
MSIETAIFVTTFVFMGAHLLLSGRRGNRVTAEREHTAEIHEFVRPVLLFTVKAPVAMC